MKWKANSTVLIQGMTTPLAYAYVPRLKNAGTNIVAGINVGGAGEKIADIPMFDLVEEAMTNVGKIDISLIFVEPYEVLDAALEAMASQIEQIIIITPGVPPLDMVQLLKKAQSTNTFILGSGSQGIIIPDKLWLGICEPQCYKSGKVGLISRSNRLTDEVALTLTEAKLGQSMAVSLGTDGIIGASYEQWLQILEEDEETEAIVLIGQANGSAELAAAEYIASTIEKPVIAYMVGNSSVKRIFGDAATIIATQLSYSIPTLGTEKQLMTAFKEANITIAKSLSQLPSLVKKALKS
ncbi:CoA-binding domain protein [Gloeothece citriformis PCC 7424]|uniref:CoA-binding domain protein n=1 Tax=Gloeothece citriformis (strain PCC 7424) TaxID=65393 RepID=B7KAU5_GLOC7|nr:CoA-binding protein [Gloeothece citriformis]ACK68767.1 CoA-binding domain protein [Gloeothece citriformis PCC 7424]